MRPRHRPHLVTTAILVGLTGVVTGLAAAGRIGPFDALGAEMHVTAAQVPSAPLRADSLFPAPTPPPVVHEQIIVADPPQRRAPSPTSIPRYEATPTPAPAASPTPTPCYDDCGGSGGGGGDG